MYSSHFYDCNQCFKLECSSGLSSVAEKKYCRVELKMATHSSAKFPDSFPRFFGLTQLRIPQQFEVPNYQELILIKELWTIMCTLLMVSIKKKRPACILSVLFPLEKCIKRLPLLMIYSISDMQQECTEICPHVVPKKVQESFLTWNLEMNKIVLSVGPNTQVEVPRALIQFITTSNVKIMILLGALLHLISPSNQNVLFLISGSYVVVQFVFSFAPLFLLCLTMQLKSMRQQLCC